MLEANLGSDVGADTFDRYCYQAFVTVPFCIRCAVGDGVAAVYAEFHEDIAVQNTDGSWRFLQVKTRDGELGPWRLRHLLEDGGALRSLFQTWAVASEHLVEFTLEAVLEGPVLRTDPLSTLLRGEPPGEEAVERIGDGLGCSGEQLSSFLKHLRIKAQVPSRATIEGVNRDVLGRVYPSATWDQLSGTNDRFASAIYDAMRVTREGRVYPECLFDETPDVVKSIRGKRLTKSELEPFVAALAVPTLPVLRGWSFDETSVPMTVLEQKLLAGGATADVIQSAKMLRAAASTREQELLSADPKREDDFDELRTRLKVLVDARVGRFITDAGPARAAWPEVLEQLMTAPTANDPQGLMGQDYLLLMGQVAELTDRCMSKWSL